MSVINTNITSMIGQQNLSKSQNDLQTSMERLSSGLRINSAKDDAAGQAIANRMSAQITGLATAQRNANDGISVAQTAEGALNQVNDNLQRIRELAVQAENGTNSSNDLDSIQNEINQRLSEINRISDETSFNDTKVLQSDQGMKIQVGANDGEAITIDLKEINAKSLGLEGFNVTGAGEVANTAATKDELVLGGFESQGVTDGVERFTNVLDNEEATGADVLGQVANGDTVTFTGTSNGFNTPASSDYTFDATSNSYSFDATGVASADAITSLTPATGEKTSATVTIDGSDEEVLIDSDGNLTALNNEGNEVKVYLDETGNLTKNGSDSLNQATLESLAGSMTDTAAPTALGTTVTEGTASTVGSVDITFEALEANQSFTVAGLEFTASESMTADDVAAAFSEEMQNSGDYAGNGGTSGSFTGAFDATDTTDGSAGDWDASSITVTNNVLSMDTAGPAAATTGLAITTSESGNTGTGGTIEVGDTTYTASGTAAFDVTGASISADALAAEVEGSDYTVNLDGNQYDIDSTDGSVAQTLQAISVTENFGTAGDPASIDVEFGNLRSGESYTLDDVTFTASEDVTGDQVASAFASALGGNFDSELGAFTEATGGAPATATTAFDTMNNGSTGYTTTTDGGTLTVTTVANDDGTGAAGTGFGGGVTSSESGISEETYVNANEALVADESSTIERFVQANGTVTDSSARQVFVDQAGELTFDAVTEAERSSLSELDDALSTVDGLRSDLGAIQNRMESAIENLSTTETNLSAARSRIEDADYAVEVANMTRSQILQQAGTSVLAQANQIPQSVLSLLG
tara:strand:+ start:10020 stop:12464 length:2445 start_codon:yes stop_codon:yes gene_type:complete